MSKIVPDALFARALETARTVGLLKTYQKRSLDHPVTIFDEDTFLVSYPRSGSTWLRFMTTGLLWHREVSYKTVRRVIPGIHTRSDKELQYAPFPRILKSHAPVNPRYPKVIYLMRDGRDVAVSFYYFKKRRGQIYRDFSDFLRKFMSGQTSSTGKWQEHVLSWTKYQDEVPFLLVSYESLQANTSAELSRIANFLNIEYAAEDIERAIRVGDFSQMRLSEEKHYQQPRQSNNQYEIRKGVIGDWKNHFSETDNDLFWEFAGDAMRAGGYQQ